MADQLMQRTPMPRAMNARHWGRVGAMRGMEREAMGERYVYADCRSYTII